MVRTIEEATKVIDEIVGRCVRDLAYGQRVLDDPEVTLAEYEPCDGILEDFRALADHREEALAGWQRLRAIMYEK
jgi:hypothetical protein